MYVDRKICEGTKLLCPRISDCQLEHYSLRIFGVCIEEPPSLVNAIHLGAQLLTVFLPGDFLPVQVTKLKTVLCNEPCTSCTMPLSPSDRKIDHHSPCRHALQLHSWMKLVLTSLQTSHPLGRVLSRQIETHSQLLCQILLSTIERPVSPDSRRSCRNF